MKIGMLCPRRKRSDPAVDYGPVIDIQKLIQDYVWKEFTRDVCCIQGIFVRRSDFIIDIPWSFFEIYHRTVKFTPRSKLASGLREQKQVVLFSTNFRNNTQKEQSYKLKTQRHTKATTTITCQRGYMVGCCTNLYLKLQLPEKYSDCGVSAGLSGQLTVTRPPGETIEETYIWETDSDVVVEPNYLTEAKIMLTEDEMVADFEVRSTLRMPSGEAPVTIRRKKDMEIQGIVMITDLSDVFADCNVSIIEVTAGDRKITYHIEITTIGILQSIRWRNQRILLESHPIDHDVKLDSAREHMKQTQSTSLESKESVIPIETKEVCSQVVRHATRSMDANLVPHTPQEEDRSEKSEKSEISETKDMRFPNIPTIITEMAEEQPPGMLKGGEKQLSPMEKSMPPHSLSRRQSVPVALKTSELPIGPLRQTRSVETGTAARRSIESPTSLAKVTSSHHSFSIVQNINS
eukprot:XP_014769338.1 PREDICTED: uncharacterized protein LOC106868423 isoform X2 [Octopus bimaculoides]